MHRGMSSEFDEYKSNQNSELVKQVLVKAGGIITIQNSKLKTFSNADLNPY